MPMGPQIAPPVDPHVLHRTWVGLQSVIMVFPDHTHLLFYNGIHEKYCLKPLSLYRALLFDKEHHLVDLY